MNLINKNKFRIITIMVSFIICLMVIYLHLLSHEMTQKIYLEQTETTIINLKKDFLKDTVNNVFLEIDTLRETKYNNYKKNTDSRLRRFQEKLDLIDEEFIKFFIDNFNNDLNPNMWAAFLWNNKTGEILYGSSDLHIVTIDSTVNNLKSLLSSYVVIEKGNIEGIFGVSKSYIDEIVKKEIGDIIRNRKFANDSYIWVNEVIKYEGGKNYAIRKVHPNLRDTEGTYLSTDMEDIKGNLPYLEELEGVKKNGEIFSTYYFKKLDSSTISEKITYAKLYKDYDWIIAMGVHLDDIDAYAEKINIAVYSLSSESIIRLLRYIFAVLLFGFTILYFVEKNHISTSTRSLQKEINLDALTKACSRIYGEKNLSAFFKQYRIEGENPAIMLFDIDDFKHINDNYGHEVGDIVLIEIVRIVNHIIRSSDQLIRWGGDEFVGIFPGLREEHILEFGEKLLGGISSLRIPIGNETISITISIGFSYFKDTDNNYKDALKRSDAAMYKSKQQGKDTVNILL
ncbi:diguanylate cyclase [Tissierella sp.]|uniref:diguanylate cyclase n=1 Tax=Tissierella sp. TaxID=41274 RepID=UPI002859AD27|nr:diguanylate cyclase [Tissierella sp.]MDR7855221.1 diguanylate cyclase [Tissierella sp.]